MGGSHVLIHRDVKALVLTMNGSPWGVNVTDIDPFWVAVNA